MTPRQMQIGFSQYFESIGSPSLLESDDIFMWLNLAQEEIIRTRYNGLNLQKRGFEQSADRIDELKDLVVHNWNVDAVEFVSVYGNDKFYSDLVEFNTDHYIFVSCKALIHYKVPAGSIITSGDPAVRSVSGGPYSRKKILVRISQQDDIWRMLEDPFNRSSHKQPIGVIGKDGLYIYTDDTFIVEEADITYIRKPLDISLSVDDGGQECELPDFLHREIVDMAIRMFKENRGRLVPQEAILTSN